MSGLKLLWISVAPGGNGSATDWQVVDYISDTAKRMGAKPGGLELGSAGVHQTCFTLPEDFDRASFEKVIQDGLQSSLMRVDHHPVMPRKFPGYADDEMANTVFTTRP